MPTSDSRSCNLSTPEAGVGGFTLIEILVVLLVVTILVGITVPNIPAFVDKADYDLEARRLELLLNMARGEAVLDSTEYGFDLTDDGYEFLRYDEGSQQWRGQTAPFQARELPEGLTLDVRVADSAFSLLGETRDDAAGEAFGGVHRDTAHGVLTEVLCDFHSQVVVGLADARVGHLEGVVDGGQRTGAELDVDDGPMTWVIFPVSIIGEC